MNIDEFRALKEQMQEQDSNQEQPVAEETEPKPEENTDGVVDETKQDEAESTTTAPTIPSKIEIEGVGEVDVEELKKGYLRASDYTKKTQMVATQRKEAEEALELLNMVKSNPQLAQELSQRISNPNIDPTASKISQLEDRIFDLMLDNEVKTLENKYPDFDPQEAIKTAQEKSLNNLEDAYLLNKSKKDTNTPKESVDIEKIKAEIREELKRELEGSKDTSTIISSSAGGKVEAEIPSISENEVKVAKNMFRHEKDPIATYVKWRDKK